MPMGKGSYGHTDTKPVGKKMTQKKKMKKPYKKGEPKKMKTVQGKASMSDRMKSHFGVWKVPKIIEPGGSKYGTREIPKMIEVPPSKKQNSKKVGY